MDKYRRAVGFFSLVLCGFIPAMLLFTPSPALGQTVVGTITSPADTVWKDMALYQNGGVFFIADATNKQILIYNATTLSYVGTISLSSYVGEPQQMALHQATGTLYVAVDWGYATSDSTIVIIDADSYTITDDITDLGMDISLGIDEGRGRLYAEYLSNSLDESLAAINVNTNAVVGNFNIDDLMGGGILSFSTDTWLNPVTGELVFCNRHYDRFVVVNGLAMTGQLITASSSRGWHASWNPEENKIYITTITWGGYLIYDRDTGSSVIKGEPCITDATYSCYSELTNRTYTDAEVDGEAVVFEGDTDACQAIDLVSGLSAVGFLYPTHHVYFASSSTVKVLDEDSLTVVSTITGCSPGAYGAVDHQILVSQQLGRVFIRNYWSSPTEGNCVQVIEEPLPISHKVDFNGDGQEDILWRYNGSGGYNRAWFLGDTGGAGSPMKPLDIPMQVSPAGGKPSGAEGMKMAFSDRRSKDAAQRGRSKPKGPGGILDIMKTRTVGLAMVDDPRKAGQDLLKPSPKGYADPRQVLLTLDPERSTAAKPDLAAAPVLLGGADVMPVGDLNWQIMGTGDFNNDTHVDILWRNISSGANVVWLMNGAEWNASAELLPVGDLSWQIVGTGDFNRDTHVDILWRNSSSGTNVVWYMDGTNWIGSAVLLGVSDPSWQIVGTGDFNRDGNVDILWRYSGTGGYNVVWYMSGATWVGSAELIPVGDSTWQIAGTGDYDNDGNVDILWRYNGAGGYNYIWYMDGVSWTGGGDLLPVADLTWRIVSR